MSSRASQLSTGEPMAVKTPAEILEEMRRKYQESPKLQSKWRVVAGVDEHGYSDFFFYGPRAGIWQIKGEMKNPYELVGAGSRVFARDINQEIRELMEQGQPMHFGMISPHPRDASRVIIATGVGKYSETTGQLKETIHGLKRDLELRMKLDKLRRELGLDLGYG